jgi:4-hydroxybenzoate polyprenyltransferase
MSPVKRAPDAPRTLTAGRRIGYRLLPGDAFSYVLHLRPREWPIMAAHTALGFFLAVGVERAIHGVQLDTLAAALVIWVGCLNGGTLALNSAFDRDEGDIGSLDAPPPVPPHQAAWGIGLMAIGQLLGAFVLPPAFALAYAACFAMSLLYSVPPARLKAVAGADWAINLVGFGALTPYAGWAATGRTLTPTAAWVLVAFAPLFAALYPLTQLYQLEEDRRRGDRTLAILLGMDGSLLVALGGAVVAFACFARAAWLARVSPLGWVALGLALGSWAVVLLPWWRRRDRMSADQHKRGMYSALVAWGVTDIAVLLAFAWPV